jgi:hypothetical protein
MRPLFRHRKGSPPQWLRHGPGPMQPHGFLEGQAGPPRMNEPQMIRVGPGDCDHFFPHQCTVIAASSLRSGLPSISLTNALRLQGTGVAGGGVAWRDGIDGQAGATRQLGEAARHKAWLGIG